MNDTSARPLRADAERNLRRILAAAQEVFAERGVDVTLDEIAQHAGVGVGTVYRRFANREELVEAIFEDTIGRMVAKAELALEHEDAWQGLELFFRNAAHDLASDRGLRDVFLQGSHGRTRVAAARERLTPVVDAVFTRAQRAGVLRDDIEVTDFPFIQVMLGAVVQQSRSVRPELWERYLALVLDGLRHDRSGPTALPLFALGKDEFDRTMS